MEKMQDEQVLNALSRRDNETYICSDCGVQEAMFDWEINEEKKAERMWLTKIEEEAEAMARHGMTGE